jgi:uncharacterized membrane protein YbjE (DUF340 family)
MNLLALLFVLTLGALAGYLLRLNDRAIAWNRSATRFAIAFLLLFMGTKLAQQRALFARDLSVLGSAVLSSVLLVLVYFLAFWGLEKLRHHHLLPRVPATRAEHRVEGHELAAVAWNAGWIACGFLLFVYLPVRFTQAIPVDAAADWILRLLLVVIGFDLGAEFHKLAFRELPLPLLLLPLVNILATLGCGLLFALLRGIPARHGLLLYSGLGWYSLSSVLIAQHGMALFALLAFIHNVLRELLSILTAPLAARISPYLPIYLGGATSMDVMLPFVQRYSGRTYTLVAFYSGIVCSLAVIPLVRIFI